MRLAGVELLRPPFPQEGRSGDEHEEVSGVKAQRQRRLIDLEV
jgi:hypothetical protein